ncbi:hypothetical protein [Candidatus Protochlamydia phocaeensis]|uniref:hypothetical protein n=1 Tax=Candidatus Protochlamydia phocaeensis TaxID=1414722 RepID=UPI0008382FE3|nr:hypothetical protein [Candidatus Protochlamydia phocaeensis]
MKNILQRSLYFFTFALFATFSIFNLFAEEKLFCPFDERTWKIGFEELTSDQWLVEMILTNEEILNWNELFTVQKFEGLPISAEEFAKILHKTFKEHVSKGQELHFKEFDSSLNIFESSFVSKNKNALKQQDIAYDEYNIGRLLKGESGLYFIRYSTKDGQTFEKNKQAWIDRLKQAYLAAEPKADQEGHWITFSQNGIYDGQKKLTFQAINQVIANQKAGFALSLPSEWLVDEQETVETGFDKDYPYTISLLFSSPGHQIYGGVAYYIPPEEKNHLPPKPIKRYLSLYHLQDPQVELVDKGNIQTVLGEKGYYIHLKNENETGWIAFFKKNQHLYRIELWGEKQQADALVKDFKRLIVNFQILNSQADEDLDLED